MHYALRRTRATNSATCAAKSAQLAEHWLLEAALEGDPEVQCQLGRLYMQADEEGRDDDAGNDHDAGGQGPRRPSDRRPQPRACPERNRGAYRPPPTDFQAVPFDTFAGPFVSRLTNRVNHRLL